MNRWLWRLALLTLPFAAYGISTILQPEQHAQVHGCTQISDDSYMNTCDEPLNLGICWSRTRGLCALSGVLPAHGSLRLVDFTAGQGAASGAQILVICRPPYRPAMVSSSTSTLRLERGCLPQQD